MIEPITLARMREVAKDVSADCKADASKWEGAKFDGASVGTQLGEIRAQIDALARMIDTILGDMEGGS